jgi:hypothetical protein
MSGGWEKAFEEVTGKTHTEQSIWWLNGFWEEGASEYAERIWDYCHLAIEITSGVKKMYGSKAALAEVDEMCDLDEMHSHVFLEKSGETLTVRDLRARLKDLDIDQNNRMALTEFFIDAFSKTPQAVVDAPQGNIDKALLDAAMAAMEAANAALQKAIAEAEAAATAAAEADAAAAVLRAAVDELERIEKEFNDKLAALDAKGSDMELGVVKRNRAVNEAAQMRSEDPLPLRKAKITQGAALKKSEKAAKKAAAAAAAAAASLEQAQGAFAQAEEQLVELKRGGGDGVSHGKLWWMQRELNERKKFMPRGKK